MTRLLPLLGSALLVAQSLFVALPGGADPLRMLDLEALADQAGPYEMRIGQVRVGPLPDGTLVQILRSGDIDLCDPGPGPAFGSAVVDVMQAQMLLRECPQFNTLARAARLDALRDLALPRYAGLVDASQRRVRRAYAAALDGMQTPMLCDDFVATWISNWTSPEFEETLRQSMERDRYPAYACTWIAHDGN
ncbi:hypothetical protein KUL25_13425 [Rhodobacteraceae bacterium N5(2021)]|uniref:Uncharacterized protein n=1 Tax=Gymnodinialimonas phycosphaerae TaxID=2841589 RepID=A0A975YEN0_9RHOB|nr:hypothetical protein [Gymnodinialimonas phycosphaerae]MBY4893765.1 hypothetical protein [Gymnodinialimonas phycosphaerae]